MPLDWSNWGKSPEEARRQASWERREAARAWAKAQRKVKRVVRRAERRKRRDARRARRALDKAVRHANDQQAARARQAEERGKGGI